MGTGTANRTRCRRCCNIKVALALLSGAALFAFFFVEDDSLDKIAVAAGASSGSGIRSDGTASSAAQIVGDVAAAAGLAPDIKAYQHDFIFSP